MGMCKKGLYWTFYHTVVIKQAKNTYVSEKFSNFTVDRNHSFKSKKTKMITITAHTLLGINFYNLVMSGWI